MKPSIIFIFSLLTINTVAKNYFVNPSAYSSAQKATKKEPWKSLDSVNKNMNLFSSGDTIFLKSGELFIGTLQITASGLAKAPLVFMSYGDPTMRPLFQYPLPDNNPQPNRVAIRLYKSSYVVISGISIADTTMDIRDHSAIANVAYAVSLDKCSNVTLNNVDVSLVGIGIEIKGDNNLVSNCKIHNLRMIVNTPNNENDDYGAVAVVLGGSNNKIENNVFMNCWGTSVDFGYDGGGIEVFGNQASNNRIENNIVINCNGFMEFGSNSGGLCTNTVITNNFLINNGLIFYIHNGGAFNLAVSKLNFNNNIIAETANLFTRQSYLIGIGPNRPDKNDIINIKNNLFLIYTESDLLASKLKPFAKNKFTHTGNIYYLKGGKLNFDPEKSEVILDSDPVLKFDELKSSVQLFLKLYFGKLKLLRNILAIDQ